MGNIHLYAFDIYAVQYGSFELMMGSPRVPLAQFSFRKSDKFSYTYDMGDGWAHEIRIESICVADPKKSYPLCTGGSTPRCSRWSSTNMVLSRLRSGLSTHLCGLSLKCQGAFAA